MTKAEKTFEKVAISSELLAKLPRTQTIKKIIKLTKPKPGVVESKTIARKLRNSSKSELKRVIDTVQYLL